LRMDDRDSMHICARCGLEFSSSDPDASWCVKCSKLLQVKSIPDRPNLPKKGSYPGFRHDHSQKSPQTIIEWQPGQVLLDTYEVKGKLGEGGMGIVYRVHHKAWNIDLALKQPKSDVVAKAGVETFVNEAQAWVDMGLHPHITTCYYVRNIDELPCVFAELVEGGSLDDWIKKGKLHRLEDMLDVAIQFAWGLHYAHELGMIHQDVKPENVLIKEDGIVKVTDFGLVKVQTTGLISISGKGTILAEWGGGTEAYFSPEQSAAMDLSNQAWQWAKAGEKDLSDKLREQIGQLPKPTRRTDLWSWAVSVLEMFNGERTGPYGSAALEHLESYLENGPALAGLPAMPPAVGALLKECFQENPERRLHNMQLVADRLVEVYQEVTGKSYSRQEPKAVDLRADSLNNKALSLLDLGQPDEAEKAWQQALTADPHHLEAVYNLGLHCWRHGQQTDQEAILALENAARSHPDVNKSEILLAQMRSERGETQDKSDSPGCWAVLKGHRSSVDALAVAPSGKFGLSGDWTGQLNCWKTESATRLWSVKAHQGEIYGLAITPDSRKGLSASGGPNATDTTIRLWNLVNGQNLKTYPIHRQWVTSLAISPDGLCVLSTSHDRTVRYWELATGKVLAVLRGHPGWVKCAVFSPSGLQAASVDWNGTLCLWDMEHGNLSFKVQAHENGIWKVVYTPDGGHLITAGADDRNLRIWRTGKKVPLAVLKGHRDPVQDLAISKDGHWLLSGGWDHTLRLWNLDERRCQRTFEDSTDAVTAVAFLPGDQKAVSSGWDNRVRFWDLHGSRGKPTDWAVCHPVQSSEALVITQKIELVRQREHQAEAGGHPQEAAREIRKARAIKGFERDPGLLADWNRLGARYGRRTSLEGCRLMKVFESDGHSDVITAICPDSSGQRLLTAGYKGVVSEWDGDSGECLQSLQTDCRKIYGLARLSDREAVCTGNKGDLIFIDLEQNTVSRSVTAHRLSINAMAVSPLGRNLATISNDNSVQCYDVSGTRLWTADLGEYPTAVQFSSDGQALIAGTMGVVIRLDMQGRQVYRQTEGSGAHCLNIAPDNRKILGGGYGKDLKVWEMETGRLLGVLSGHTDLINVCTQSADGRFGISAGNDEILRFWDLRDSICLREISGHHTWVNAIRLAPDNTYLWSGDYGGRIYTWQVDWDYEFPDLADWHEGARPYLEIFLTLHTPYGPDGFTHRGKPTWTEEDFQQFLVELGYRGYGWLRPEGVRRKLDELTQTREGSRD
jgi:WD40 repeat protein